MPGSSKTLIEVTIAAADRLVWRGKASMVSVPASEGSMGILADHEPVMAATSDGTVTVTTDDGKALGFKVADGFISFDSNKLTVAVERCEEMGEVSATTEE